MVDERLRILIVTDDAALAGQVHAALVATGDELETRVADSLQVAQERCAAFTPHLVIANTTLPDGSWTGLLPAAAHAAAFPVVTLIEPGDEQAAAEALRAGALDFCVKSAEAYVNLPHVVSRTLREWTHMAERGRAEHERRILETQLRQVQKLEAIGTLATGVAHDFNNLLTAIVGYAELALAAVPDDSDAARSLQGVLDAAEQATGVAQSLRTFSQRAPSQKLPVHLGHMLGDMQRIFHRMVPVSVELEMASFARTGCFWVWADRTQLQQLVMNLVVNAREAMPDGGTLGLTLQNDPTRIVSQDSAASNPCGAVVLLVEDTGRGMSSDVRDRLFDPFFTTKERDTGTGLGMSVVHGIVADHDGSVHIDTQEGTGTRVTITFPCCDRPKQCIEHYPLLEIGKGHGETILVADSAPQILAILTSALRSNGYDVLQATDGERAARLYRAHRDRTRLMILDMDLPKKNGLTLLRELRADNDPLPAIVVTDGPDPELEEGSLPGIRLVRKPFHLGALLTLVHDVLHAPSPARP